MTFISERGINYHMFPITGTVPPGNIIKTRKNQIVFEALEGSQWDLNCYILMDLIATHIRKIFVDRYQRTYGDIPSRSTAHHMTENCPYLSRPDLLDIYQKEIESPGHYAPEITQYAISFDIFPSNYLEQPQLKSWNHKTLKDTLEKITSCKVKCNYQFKSESSEHINGIRKHDFNHAYQMNTFESLFEYNVILGKRSPDNKRYGSYYQLNFNTPLSSVFVHNIYTCAYTLIDQEIYSLSKSAQLLYRKRFLPWSGKYKTTLKQNTVINDLCINNKNKTELRKKFNNIIDELYDLKFISISEDVVKDGQRKVVASKFTKVKSTNVVPMIKQNL